MKQSTTRQKCGVCPYLGPCPTCQLPCRVVREVNAAIRHTHVLAVLAKLDKAVHRMAISRAYRSSAAAVGALATVRHHIKRLGR